MIAVTKAAADRGWVAVPFARSWETPPDPDDQMFLGITVAVVEEDHLYRSLDPVLGTLVTDRFMLTGFANVTEVVPIWGYADDDTHDPDNVGKHLWLDPETGECAIWYNMGSPATNSRHLPHAEPGGLALRLEPIECTPDCYGGIVDQCSITGESCPFTGIGSPVSVVDWSGELGRWDR